MPSAISISKHVPILKLSHTLDGTDYVLNLSWNMRNGWYLGLSDANNSVIFSPVKLVLGENVLARARYDSRCPPGALVAYDTTASGLEAGYLDLASGFSAVDLQGRVVLAYYSQDELA